MLALTIAMTLKKKKTDLTSRKDQACGTVNFRGMTGVYHIVLQDTFSDQTPSRHVQVFYNHKLRPANKTDHLCQPMATISNDHEIQTIL